MCQKTLQSLGMFLALGCVGFAPSAFAGDYPCPPNLGPVTIDGNVVVKSACTLNGTTVKGNVLVYSGGSLITQKDKKTKKTVYIDGNIQAKDAVSVTVKDETFVDGDIQLENLRGKSPSSITKSAVMGNIQLKNNRQSVTVEKNEVDGDIQLEGLRSATQASIVNNDVKGNIQLKSNYLPLSVVLNDVDGDVQAFSNRYRSNPLFISENTIDGNLQCKSNNPAPTGGNNRVSGSKEDQCRRL